MDYFIADTHFNHANAIEFDDRPFSDVKEMNDTMIHLWNKRVTPKDNVFILGDFAYRADLDTIHTILRKLGGRKYLLRGNHDAFVDDPKFDKSLFIWIKDYHRDVVDGKRVVLCHYPLAVWDQAHRDAVHLYGHVHLAGFDSERFPQLRLLRNAYNACASVNNFMPCTLQEIIANNETRWGNL